MDIIIDTRGDSDLTNRDRLMDSDDDDDMEIKIGNLYAHLFFISEVKI